VFAVVVAFAPSRAVIKIKLIFYKNNKVGNIKVLAEGIVKRKENSFKEYIIQWNQQSYSPASFVPEKLWGKQRKLCSDGEFHMR
jgi:hypothetical protein